MLADRIVYRRDWNGYCFVEADRASFFLHISIVKKMDSTCLLLKLLDREVQDHAEKIIKVPQFVFSFTKSERGNEVTSFQIMPPERNPAVVTDGVLAYLNDNGCWEVDPGSFDSANGIHIRLESSCIPVVQDRLEPKLSIATDVSLSGPLSTAQDVADYVSLFSNCHLEYNDSSKKCMKMILGHLSAVDGASLIKILPWDFLMLTDLVAVVARKIKRQDEYSECMKCLGSNDGSSEDLSTLRFQLGKHYMLKRIKSDNCDLDELGAFLHEIATTDYEFSQQLYEYLILQAVSHGKGISFHTAEGYSSPGAEKTFSDSMAAGTRLVVSAKENMVYEPELIVHDLVFLDLVVPYDLQTWFDGSSRSNIEDRFRLQLCCLLLQKDLVELFRQDVIGAKYLDAILEILGLSHEIIQKLALSENEWRTASFESIGNKGFVAVAPECLSELAFRYLIDHHQQVVIPERACKIKPSSSAIESLNGLEGLLFRYRISRDAASDDEVTVPSRALCERLFPGLKILPADSTDHAQLVTPEYFLESGLPVRAAKTWFFGIEDAPWAWIGKPDYPDMDPEWMAGLLANGMLRPDFSLSQRCLAAFDGMEYKIIPLMDLPLPVFGPAPVDVRLLIGNRDSLEPGPRTRYRAEYHACLDSKLAACNNTGAQHVLMFDIFPPSAWIAALQDHTGCEVLSTTEAWRRMVTGKMRDTVVLYCDAISLLEASRNPFDPVLSEDPDDISAGDEDEDCEPGQPVVEQPRGMVGTIQSLVYCFATSGGCRLILADPGLEDIGLATAACDGFTILCEYLDLPELSGGEGVPPGIPEGLEERLPALVLGNGAVFSPEQQACLAGFPEDGKDTDYLIVLPTGYGKTAVFLALALRQSLLTGRLGLVISPLSSIIVEQLDRLERLGLGQLVGGLYSGVSDRRWILRGLAGGETMVVYITPERLRDPDFRAAWQARLARDKGAGPVVFDEAHCLASWGTTFRPDYLRALDAMKELRQGGAALAGLVFCTATAPRRLRAFLQERSRECRRELLGNDDAPLLDEAMKRMHHEIVDAVTVRRNSQGKSDLHGLLTHFYERIHKAGIDWDRSRALVYVSRRRYGEEAARLWNESWQSGPRASFFHAGLPKEARKERYDEFLNRSCGILFATEAFGMGMDVPDIHVVGHLDMPETIEAYVQRCGRAMRGRDQSSYNSYALASRGLSIAYHDDERTRLYRDSYIRQLVSPRELHELYGRLRAVLSPGKTGLFLLGADVRERYGLYRAREASREDLACWHLERSGAIATDVQRSMFHSFAAVGERWQAMETANPVLARIKQDCEEAGYPAEFPLLVPVIPWRSGEDRDGDALAFHEVRDLVKGGYLLDRNEVRFKRGRYWQDGTALPGGIRLSDYNEILIHIVKQFRQHDAGQESELVFREKNGPTGDVLVVTTRCGHLVEAKEYPRFREFHASWIVDSLRQAVPVHEEYSRPCAKSYRFRLENIESVNIQFMLKIERSKRVLELVNGVLRERGMGSLPLFEMLEQCDLDSPASLEAALGLLRSLAIVISPIPLVPAGRNITLLDQGREPDVDGLAAAREEGLRYLFGVDLLACLQDAPLREFCSRYFTDERSLGDLAADLADKAEGEPREKLSAVIRQMQAEAYDQRYRELSDEQRALVDYPLDKHLIVDAGPGSGKTHTIILRLARLVFKEQVRPERIMLLAYNRSVMLEIKRRLRELFAQLGFKSLVSGIRVYTFHALVRRLIPEILERTKNEYENHEAHLKSYETSLLKALDQDLSILTAQLGTVEYLFVDEFQDVNWRRMRVFECFRQAFSSMRICAIGDTDQSIYGYERLEMRNYHPTIVGGNPRVETEEATPYFSYFRKTYCPGDDDLPLAENRRSFQEIVNYSGHWRQSDKPNLSHRGTGGQANRLVYAAGALVRQIEAHLGNAQVRTVGVLFRTNRGLYSAYQELSQVLHTRTDIVVRIQGDMPQFASLREVHYYLERLRDGMPGYLDLARAQKLVSEAHLPVWDDDLRDMFLGLLEDYCADVGARATFQGLTEYVESIESRDIQYLFKLLLSQRSDKRAIVFSTVHKAKGLEYDAVIFCGDDPGTQGDVGRVNYVACTRARNVLTLIENFTGNAQVMESPNIRMTLYSPASLANEPEVFERYRLLQVGQRLRVDPVANSQYHRYNVKLDNILMGWFNDSRNLLQSHRFHMPLVSVSKYSLEECLRFDSEHNRNWAGRWSPTARERGFIFLPVFNILERRVDT